MGRNLTLVELWGWVHLLSRDITARLPLFFLEDVCEGFGNGLDVCFCFFG